MEILNFHIFIILEFIQAGVHCGFTISWELFHPLRPVDWARAILKGCNAVMSVFHMLSPLVMFTIFGELLVLYYIKMKCDLENWINNASLNESFAQIANTLRIIPYLQCATRVLLDRFGFSFIFVWLSSTISVMNICYYLVHSKSNASATIWNCLQLVLHATKLFLICHTSNRIRCSVKSIHSHSSYTVPYFTNFQLFHYRL